MPTGLKDAETRAEEPDQTAVALPFSSIVTSAFTPDQSLVIAAGDPQ
ncbi:MAG TPA: hypothetical protein VE817_05120 [Candidatus Acidoferrum sp.]|nr:hypothetical protein [Candidatus Acidoferrum sp.]